MLKHAETTVKQGANTRGKGYLMQFATCRLYKWSETKWNSPGFSRSAHRVRVPMGASFNCHVCHVSGSHDPIGYVRVHGATHRVQADWKPSRLRRLWRGEPVDGWHPQKALQLRCRIGDVPRKSQEHGLGVLGCFAIEDLQGIAGIAAICHKLPLPSSMNTIIVYNCCILRHVFVIHCQCMSIEYQSHKLFVDFVAQLLVAWTFERQGLVLFDEVEKAHPDVFNLMLQILEAGLRANIQLLTSHRWWNWYAMLMYVAILSDIYIYIRTKIHILCECMNIVYNFRIPASLMDSVRQDGRLTDSKGRVVSFKNALIIMWLGSVGYRQFYVICPYLSYTCCCRYL